MINNRVGIKINIRKLLNLFEFLDEIKEINAKGIGFGLLICKMINQVDACPSFQSYDFCLFLRKNTNFGIDLREITKCKFFSCESL